MTERNKVHNGLKWILLLSCLGINALVVHHLFSGESNLIFSKGSEYLNRDAYTFSALYVVSFLIVAIYLSLKSFANSSKINFGVLILILINLLFAGFNLFINFVGWIFSDSINNGF